MLAFHFMFLLQNLHSFIKVPQAMLDTSPVDAPLALSQFELIKARKHTTEIG